MNFYVGSPLLVLLTILQNTSWWLFLACCYINWIFLVFKNIIQDGFCQRGVDLLWVKHLAMFLLSVTVILCWLKHASVLVNIYFNDMQIYRWIYVYTIYTYKFIFANIQIHVKLFLTMKIDWNLFLKVNM